MASARTVPTLLQVLANLFGAYQLFLFAKFPRSDTLTITDYARAEMVKSAAERKESMASRFAAYKALCMWGLGSLFVGTATGFFDAILDPKHDWIHYVYIYAVCTFVFLLNGAVASSFPSSSLLAPSTAGLGAWHALILFLLTFHMASLQFHNYITECIYSMVASSVLVTVYWALSCQDPLVMHIVVKLILWIIGLVCYIICYILYLIAILFFRGLGWLFSVCWQWLWTNVNSVKNRLMPRGGGGESNPRV